MTEYNLPETREELTVWLMSISQDLGGTSLLVYCASSILLDLDIGKAVQKFNEWALHSITHWPELFSYRASKLNDSAEIKYEVFLGTYLFSYVYSYRVRDPGYHDLLVEKCKEIT